MRLVKISGAIPKASLVYKLKSKSTLHASATLARSEDCLHSLMEAKSVSDHIATPTSCSYVSFGISTLHNYLF